MDASRPLSSGSHITFERDGETWTLMRCSKPKGLQEFRYDYLTERDLEAAGYIRFVLDGNQKSHEQLVKDLWESDEANSLTNAAARAIESLQAEVLRLQDVIVSRQTDKIINLQSEVKRLRAIEEAAQVVVNDPADIHRAVRQLEETLGGR